MYIIKNKNGDLIAYSEDLEYVYKYLKMFYTKDDREKITTEITRITNNKDIAYLTINYDSYILIELCEDIVVTSWEYSLWYDYFKEIYTSGKDKLREIAIHHLSEHGKETDDYSIEMYLKKCFKEKYFTLSSFNSFMNSLSSENIKNIMKDTSMLKYIYDLNREYNQKINIDN